MIVLHPAWSQGVSDSAAQSLRESAQRVDALLKIEEARLESKVRRDQRDQAEQKDTPKISASFSMPDIFEVLAIYGTSNDLKLDLLINGLPKVGLQKGDVVKGWRVVDISVQSSCVNLVSVNAKSLDAKAKADKTEVKRVRAKTAPDNVSNTSFSLCWNGTALEALPKSTPASAAAPQAPGMLPPPPLPLPPLGSSALPPGAVEPRATPFVVRPQGNQGNQGNQAQTVILNQPKGN